MQPSSPGDYYSSVDSDLKVELTEKLFALDTEGGGASDSTEVNLLRVNDRLQQNNREFYFTSCFCFKGCWSVHFALKYFGIYLGF